MKVCTTTFAVLALSAAAIGGAAMFMPRHAAAQPMGMADKKGDIIDIATGGGMEKVTTLVTAVKAAGLVETLKGPGPFTVFAPTNEAFAKLPAGTVEMLLKPENKDKLVKILTYHVVSGSHSAKEVMGMTSAKSVEGGELTIKTADGKVMVGNKTAMATVIKTDITASNGTIHWIDTVLMPE